MSQPSLTITLTLQVNINIHSMPTSCIHCLFSHYSLTFIASTPIHLFGARSTIMHIYHDVTRQSAYSTKLRRPSDEPDMAFLNGLGKQILTSLTIWDPAKAVLVRLVSMQLCSPPAEVISTGPMCAQKYHSPPLVDARLTPNEHDVPSVLLIDLDDATKDGGSPLRSGCWHQWC